ncbi:hypothetical protein WA026_021381 [Henosepilachna vigintioctopunctata]|uniref:Uncharacterized protein n=1 Tax=Henosepilachna vigintioctopunctata TaxID=420089 RepID=A0AAW1TWQ0_9CUCU
MERASDAGQACSSGTGTVMGRRTRTGMRARSARLSQVRKELLIRHGGPKHVSFGAHVETLAMSRYFGKTDSEFSLREEKRMNSGALPLCVFSSFQLKLLLAIILLFVMFIHILTIGL